MTLAQLKAKRAKLLREADGLKKADGTFTDDQARAAFDAKMTEVDGLDAQIRTLEAGATPEPQPSTVETRAAAIASERERVTSIHTLCRAHEMDQAFEDRHIKDGTAIEAVRAAVLEKLAAGSSETRQQVTIVPGADARDKWIRGAEAWLLQRSAMAAMVAQHLGITVDKIDPGEFRGMTLLDMARESLVRAGQSVRGLDRMQLAGQAMAYRANYQTTSDFAVLLENTMHKVLRAAYAITPDTWSRWCGIGSAVDFRVQNWYRMGSLTVLDALNEAGEFKNKAIPDAEKATYQVATKGNIIGITREVIVNDDLGAVARLASMLGRAAKLTIEKAVYTQLGLNSGLGPTQSDSQALFHANRANVGTGAAISMAALDADAAVMAIQTDQNGQDILDLKPNVLLVARALEGTAKSINGAEYDPDTTGKLQKPNIVKGMFSDVVGTGRLTGTRRYLFADPSIAPVFMVSFLEGMQEPVLESQDGWRFNGVELKARLDFGVDVVDFRGAVTNAGT